MLQDILSRNQAFYRSFEKKDIAAMSEIWSQGTGSLCIHPGRSAIKGWDEIHRSWIQIFKNTNYIEIEIDVISTEVSDNLAYVVLTETVMQIAGRRKVEARSIATNIFEKMGQNWYLTHHHASPVMR